MARIRTIKPDFFRHEALQDLEIAHPGKYPMMVFEGLWGHCDNKGRFEWKPRILKLDILPFLPFDMEETLKILADSKMVSRYSVDGKEYGEIPTFEKHQRLSGKELTEGEKYPANPENEQGSNGEATRKQSGSVEEIPESQEGKGKEEEGNGVDAISQSLPEISPMRPKPVKKATGLPVGFYPNENGVAYAEGKRISLEVELESFSNWHVAKGSTMKDWQAAWRTWCDKAVEFGRAGQPNARASPKNIHDQRAETIAILTGRTQHEPINEHDITGESVRIA